MGLDCFGSQSDSRCSVAVIILSSDFKMFGLEEPHRSSFLTFCANTTVTPPRYRLEKVKRRVFVMVSVSVDVY